MENRSDIILIIKKERMRNKSRNETHPFPFSSFFTGNKCVLMVRKKTVVKISLVYTGESCKILLVYNVFEAAL